MTFSKQLNENEFTLTVAGRLDALSAPQIEAEVEAIPEGVTLLVFDFSALDYVSSAGLRVILMGIKKVENVKVLNPTECVNEVLEMTGFSDMLEIVNS